MSGSTNFKVFNEEFLNAQDDATYNADLSRVNGVSSGIASVLMHNKLFRQLSIMAAAIGQFISEQGNIASDEDLESLVSAFSASVLSPGISNKTTQQVKTLFVETDTRSIEISRVDGAISSIEIKDPSDSSVVKLITINRVDGIISSVVSVAGGKTITQSVNRVDDVISSITKAVS